GGRCRPAHATRVARRSGRAIRPQGWCQPMSREMNDRRTPTGLPVQRVIGALASTLLFLIACQDRPEADVDTTLQEARELIGDRRFGEGLAKMRALVEANPDDARLQALYGEALLASGQP